MPFIHASNTYGPILLMNCSSSSYTSSTCPVLLFHGQAFGVHTGLQLVLSIGPCSMGHSHLITQRGQNLNWFLRGTLLLSQL